MKVVCIHDKVKGFEINKVYDCESNGEVGAAGEFVLVVPGYSAYLGRHYFLPIDEYREQQLNKILN